MMESQTTVSDGDEALKRLIDGKSRLQLCRLFRAKLEEHRYYVNEIRLKGRRAIHAGCADNAKDRAWELGKELVAISDALGRLSSSQVMLELMQREYEIAKRAKQNAAASPSAKPTTNQAQERPDDIIKRRTLKPSIRHFHVQERPDKSDKRGTLGSTDSHLSPQRADIGSCSRWTERFTAMAGVVKPGASIKTSDRQMERSEDGNTLSVTYLTGGQEILKRTMLEQPDTTTTMIEVTSLKRGTTEKLQEKETTVTFKEQAPAKHQPTNTGALQNRHTPYPEDWFDFLQRCVRVNPNTMRFMIGKTEFDIDQFRFSATADRRTIASCLQTNGQIIRPCLDRLVRKLVRLQHNPDNTLGIMVESHLPVLIGNIDYFGQGEPDYPPTQASPIQQ